jgi:hypothetical protein
MGQVFFSAQLMKRFKPRSIEAVALVAQDDRELRPLLERYKGMRVVVYAPRRTLRNGLVAPVAVPSRKRNHSS